MKGSVGSRHIVGALVIAYAFPNLLSMPRLMVENESTFAERAFMISVRVAVMLLLAHVPALSATIYFPQVADGGGYTTTFTFYNPDVTAVTGTLRTFDQDGGPRTISLNGLSRSQFTISLPGLGSARYTTSGLSTTVSGWASFESQGRVVAIATFDLRTPQVLQTTAGVFAVPGMRRFMMPIDLGSRSDSGFAIANVTSDRSVTVRMQLISESGSLSVTGSDTRFNPLARHRQIADFVTSVFPTVGPGFKGTLIAEVEGAGEIAATALLVKEGVLSAIPVSDTSEYVALVGHRTPVLDELAGQLSEQGFGARVNAIPFGDATVLFAASAVDGPMPQTRQAVVDSIGQPITYAAILLTETNRVQDQELIDLVILEMRELLAVYLGQTAASELTVLRAEDPNLPTGIRAIRLSPPVWVRVRSSQ